MSLILCLFVKRDSDIWKRHVLDEIRIKESLVYDKNESKRVGFVNLGEVNDHLTKFEREASNDTGCEVATHIDFN